MKQLRLLIETRSPDRLDFTGVHESLMITVQYKYQRSQELMHTLQMSQNLDQS